MGLTQQQLQLLQVNADRCDIYTDVDGVYSTDPNIVSEAKKSKLAFEEMLRNVFNWSKSLTYKIG